MIIQQGGFVYIDPIIAVFTDTSGSTRLYAHIVNDLYSTVTIYWRVGDDNGNIFFSSSLSITSAYYITGLGDPEFIFNYLATTLGLTIQP